MASWIGATDAQRFWQYIVPAARRAIEAGEWDSAMAGYQAQGEALTAQLAQAEPGSFQARALQRRLESVRRDWASCRDSRRRDLATLAEAERRKRGRK